MHKKHGLTHLCNILYNIIIIRQRGFIFIGYYVSQSQHTVYCQHVI